MPRVDEHGRVRIPRAVREALDLQPGDDVAFEEIDGGVVLSKRAVDERFEEWHGALETDSSMAERMRELRGRPFSGRDAEQNEG